MEKLTWFKFVISDWMMGKIMKCPEVTQARFIRLCCLYWNKECVLSYEDAEIEIDIDHLNILISKKIIVKNDEFVTIKFLDEQNSDVSSLSEKRRMAVQARWEKLKKSKKEEIQNNTIVLDVDSIVLQSDTEKRREDEIRVDKNREEHIKEKIVFAKQKSELINLICEKYGYTENRHYAKKRIVMAYFDVMIKTDDDYDYFVKNFNSYVSYKTVSDEKQHGFDGLFGTQAKRFEDGALNNENWEQKLNNWHSLNKKKTKSENIADVFGEALNNLKNGHSTL